MYRTVMGLGGGFVSGIWPLALPPRHIYRLRIECIYNGGLHIKYRRFTAASANATITLPDGLTWLKATILL